MAFDEKKQALVQECATVDELVREASELGVELSIEEAQKVIDSFAMVEIDEDDFDKITGGSTLEDDYREARKDGKLCCHCQSTDTIFLYCTRPPNIVYSRNLCKNCGQMFYSLGGYSLPSPKLPK